MKKIALYLFFLIFLYFVLPTTSLSATEISVGMNLDCARAYFSPKEIKAYIDYLSKFKNSFLQLHFTDNENVGLVCETLGQTEENALLTKKGYKNAKTDTYFLSKKSIQRLDKSLQITYWSLDGDTQNPHLKRERRKHRASFLDFQKFGFKVLNYNSYYLYYVPFKENSDKKSLDYMVSGLKKTVSFLFLKYSLSYPTKHYKNRYPLKKFLTVLIRFMKAYRPPLFYK